MAIRYAIASGNGSDPAIWDGGVAVPASGDDIRSNGYTVTIDTSITCNTVSNKSETSPTVAAGGTFVLSNGVTVTATHATNGVPLSGTTGHVVFTSTLGAGSSATIIANCVHVSPAHVGAIGVSWTGAGTLHWVGNITGYESSSPGQVVSLAGANCTMYLTGNLQSGSSNGTGHGCVRISASGVTLNVTGNVTGGLAGSSSTVGGAIVLLSGALSATVDVTGSVTGGSYSPAIAVNNVNASGTITITGPMTAGAAYPAVCTLQTTGVALRAGGPFTSSAAGIFPFACLGFRWIGSPAGTYMDIRTLDLSAVRTLYTADYTTALHMPAEEDVRAGTVYGPTNELEGVLAVPPPGAVALGVPTDDTFGTAAITQQAIADAVGPLIAAYGA